MSQTGTHNMRDQRPIPGLAGRCRHCGQDVRVLHSRAEERGVQWVAIDAVEIVAYVFGEGAQSGGMPRLVRALHRCAVEDESVAGLILTLLAERGQTTVWEMTEETGVARKTIRCAFERLVASGVVRVVGRRGRDDANVYALAQEVAA